MANPTESDATETSEGPKLILGPALRYVDSTSATIWLEIDRPGTVQAAGVTTSSFSIAGHHYALIIIEDLEPGSTTPYEVSVDGHALWPEPDSHFPPSSIRTPIAGGPVSILTGSCRAAAPHEPPYSLELAFEHEGRGVDTLWAHGLRMIDENPDQWPHLLLFVGDQIYADDSSPQAKARIEQCRAEDSELSSSIVADYEEYCWLYREAWSLPVERWVLSTVPSAMILDDHDNIDDWNISRRWLDEIRQETWWEDHAVGGLMSYWVYQHLGNLSPDAIRSEGLLDSILASDHPTAILREWAIAAEASAGSGDGYRFGHSRTVGDVTVVVMDCRNARVLDEEGRLMIGDREWEWVRSEAGKADGHLVLATSLPVFIPDGLHDLQVWNERVCGGAWGTLAARLGERVRRALDLEDWSAFGESYRRFVELLSDLAGGERPPRSIIVISGDIHFSYAARVDLERVAETIPVWQVVCSPIRNALIPPERGVMRATLTNVGRRAGAALRRSVKAPDTRPGIEMAAGPFFANNMGEVRFDQTTVLLTIEQSMPGEDQSRLREVAQLELSTAPMSKTTKKEKSR